MSSADLEVGSTDYQPRYRFSDADSSKGGKRSVAVRSQAALERRAEYARVHELVDGLEREAVSELAFAAMVNAGLALAKSDAPAPQDATDYKRLVESIVLAHKVMRLEAGESTSNSATLDVTDRDARVQQLQARLAELGGSDTPSS